MKISLHRSRAGESSMLRHRQFPHDCLRKPLCSTFSELQTHEQFDPEHSPHFYLWLQWAEPITPAPASCVNPIASFAFHIELRMLQVKIGGVLISLGQGQHPGFAVELSQKSEAHGRSRP